MISKVTTAFRNAVSKYKAQRVKDVVSKYAVAADAHIIGLTPVWVDFYKDVAHSVVDKTFENPEPLVKLLDAVDGVAKHYGPALRANYEVLMHQLELTGNEPMLIKRMEALFKAVDDLAEDVNDH